MDHSGLGEQDDASLRGGVSFIVRPHDRIPRQGLQHLGAVFHSAGNHGVWIHQARFHTFLAALVRDVAQHAGRRPHRDRLPTLVP